MYKKSAQNSALKSAKNGNLLLKVPKIVPKKELNLTCISFSSHYNDFPRTKGFRKPTITL